MGKVSKQEFNDLEERVEKLEDMLNYPSINSSPLYHRLYPRITGLWDKYNRLLDFLDLEDVTVPDSKIIRKKKQAKDVRARVTVRPKDNPYRKLGKS